MIDKKIIIGIAFDLFIFSCLYSVFIDNSYASYAENIVLVMFNLQGILGVIILMGNEKEIIEKFNDINPTKKHLMYQKFIFILEIIILAALGMFWTLAIYFIGASGFISIKEKIIKQRQLDAQEKSNDQTI